MTIQQALNVLVARRDLTREDAREVLASIMRGEATPAQIAGFLVALRMKGETEDEITGFAQAMRDAATKVPVQGSCLDTCGTGGDRSGTFNISTTSALVAAGAGVTIAKHGNRGISSQSGSADVLQALGVALDLDPIQAGRCVDEARIGFLFAPNLHSAMRHVAAPRRELGLRTVFNLLGPLTSPACARRQVIGVYDDAWCAVLARVLRNLGSERVWVVHGSDGLDELTTTGMSRVAEWTGSEIREFEVHPSDADLPVASAADLKGGNPEENAAIVRAVLAGEKGPRRDIVVLNAAAALVVAEKVPDLRAGARLAERTIDSGEAAAALDRLIAVGRKLVQG